jgi:hypothetical protein
VGQSHVLLWFGHVGHCEQCQLLFGERQICRFGVQVFLESVGAVLVHGEVSFEVWVDVVDAEVDLQIELQSFCGLVAGDPKSRGDAEELLACAFIEGLQDGVSVVVVAGLVGADLYLCFEVGALGLEGLVGAEVA